jgi:hypothetical protein
MREEEKNILRSGGEDEVAGGVAVISGWIWAMRWSDQGVGQDQDQG